jgi:exodeoxyribonuclease V alpha subunit
LLSFLRATDLEETRAYLAWELSQMAALAPSQRDELALLCARLLAAEEQGSTRLALAEKDLMLLRCVPELVGQPRAEMEAVPPQYARPLVLDGHHLYSHRSHACETRVAAALAARLDRASPFPGEAILAVLRDAATTAVPVPSPDQGAAVVHALSRRLGVISGGPGTGKTTTALTLVRCLVRLGVPTARVALCAPTGKAASRMEDDFRRRLADLTNPDPADVALVRECPRAQTLHRLLGASSDGRFRHLSREPLPVAAVVVDECSMVDLSLMDALLSALPDTALVFLLGDADQLPSVAAGSVFRDLDAHAARLEHGLRTSPDPAGERLAELARAVRAGNGVLPLCESRSRFTLLRYQGAEQIPGEQRAELLRQHYRRHFTSADIASLARQVYTIDDGCFAPDDSARLDRLLSALMRCRILTVTREHTSGSLRANAFLHDMHGGGAGFAPGEPVLMLRNDYQRELWNGGQGVAILVRRAGRLPTVEVAFPSRTGWQVVDPVAMSGALEHAYALTTHKAQGSEFDEVLFLLPDFASPLLTRELLYTAVSRARKSVVLCGSPDMIGLAIATRQERDSGIAARLAYLLEHRTGLTPVDESPP